MVEASRLPPTKAPTYLFSKLLLFFYYYYHYLLLLFLVLQSLYFISFCMVMRASSSVNPPRGERRQKLARSSYLQQEPSMIITFTQHLSI